MDINIFYYALPIARPIGYGNYTKPILSWGSKVAMAKSVLNLPTQNACRIVYLSGFGNPLRLSIVMATKSSVRMWFLHLHIWVSVTSQYRLYFIHLITATRSSKPESCDTKCLYGNRERTQNRHVWLVYQTRDLVSSILLVPWDMRPRLHSRTSVLHASEIRIRARRLVFFDLGEFHRRICWCCRRPYGHCCLDIQCDICCRIWTNLAHN